MNAAGAVGSTAGPGTRIPAWKVARCAARTVRLPAVRLLHIGHSHVGSTVVPAVWFRLRFIPPGAHIRYGRYITSILRPVSCAATIGYDVFPDRTLTTYLDGVSTEGTP